MQQRLIFDDFKMQFVVISEPVLLAYNPPKSLPLEQVTEEYMEVFFYIQKVK